MCTRDTSEDWDGCLAAVRRPAYPCLQVVVVDNGPRDHQTQAVVEKRHVRYLVGPVMELGRVRN